MDKRLIEVAFPLKQTSLDSVHEKNVRHGHISTLHIWPARRPLAACRAALIATLLPDPDNPEERREILMRLAGTVREKVTAKRLPDGQVEETVEEYTEGGILHWGRESDPDLDWFRQRIREAYGGRAPRVLDPFAGGGAIPLEAMRLGCEVTAVDINPVAWFLLKCTLEYPHRLAGQTRPLPDFVLEDRDFMASFFKAQGFKGASLAAELKKLGLDDEASTLRLPGMEPDADLEADLAWHVRAWGWWVLQRARADIEHFYPTVDGKPTVAYLWARTVTCKNCRATVPLLKTRWLVKKGKKRVLLTMEPNAEGSGVAFGIEDRPSKGKDLGKGTMSRSGATCPCCDAIMTSKDLRLEGQMGRLGTAMTAVVVEDGNGKTYRIPVEDEYGLESAANAKLDQVFSAIPFGIPEEPVPEGASRTGGGSPFTVYLYGLKRWRDLFTPRQLLTLGTFVKHTRAVYSTMQAAGYPPEWTEATQAELGIAMDKLADRQSMLCRWDVGFSKVNSTFTRFALPILWDYTEGNPLSNSTGNYLSCVEWVAKVIDHSSSAAHAAPAPQVVQASATGSTYLGIFDAIVTDPPYYDAIPYADLMDFFYIWLRRTLHGLSPEVDDVFDERLAPKWDHQTSDGELIDDASRFDGDKEQSKAAYELGMSRAFKACYRALKDNGRLVIVFAHKQPDAWETLVSAIIHSGFVVDGSWPIQTEMSTRSRAHGSAALSSSVWLVCKKRPPTARPGWDNRVLAEMRERITERLRDFWDAGIRGPDFVWAATGPAMEAYSQYPVVKKANEPGELLTVSEFLGHVRRMVVNFVVGRVLPGNGGTEAVSGLDDVTTYYLLHRHDFGLEEAPAGAAILYTLSCNLSDRELADRYQILDHQGSTLKLVPWSRRKKAGYDPVLDAAEAHGAETLTLPGFDVPEPELRELPLVDQAHRLMHLWKAGDVTKVDAYLDARGLRRSNLFHQLLQALIELAPAGSEERALLESISNHLGVRGTVTGRQTSFSGD
jgi:putative DNA methylase